MPILPPTAYTDPRWSVTVPSPVTVVAGEYLKDHLAPGVGVYLDLPGNVIWPAARVTRIGGVMRNVPAGLDEAILDVDLWARRGQTIGTRVEDYADKARAYLLGAKGIMHRGIVVTRTFDSAGPAPRPEDDPTLERVGFTVGWLFHPA